MTPDYVACEVEKRETWIQELQRQIQELHFSVVFDDEGEVTSYADWAA